MKLDQLFDKKVVMIGVGSIAGMFAGAVATSTLKKEASGFANKYAKLIAGGALVAGGSLLLAKGDSKLKSLALGMGGAGVSIVGSDIYSRFTDKPLVGSPDMSNAPDWSSMVPGQRVAA